MSAATTPLHAHVGDRAQSGATTAPPPWSPPTEFEDYELLHPLGRGGMGLVFLAEDTVLARQVAIKFIGTGAPDAETRQRFLIEARAAARVQHPNVVTIYRVGELDERPYLVTEFARGETLDKLPVPVEWTRVLSIGVDLARGLAAAHRKGVLHCDIKPGNAVLTDEGVAKLLDFGLATLLHVHADSPQGEEPPGDERARGVSTLRGTPDFMAPEIWGGDSASRRSDVYSVGVVLFELVAGKTPFQEVPVDRLAATVRRTDAPSLGEIAPSVDRRLAAIVDRCLRRAPEERFSSGDELREALEQLARVAGGAPVPEGNPYRGLRAFEADHRALFFGRSAEVGVVLERLRSEHFLLLTGDSGVGKSSLCRAGVLPAVAEGALGGGRTWSLCTFTPGKQPLGSLASALAPTLGVSAADLAREIEGDPHELARRVGRHLGDTAGLLLFVDQTEELITVADRTETAAVEAALARIAEGVPGVRMLATLRADFLTRFAALPTLGEDLSRVLYFLRPLSPERTRDVIVGPAEATGLRFESEELVESLVLATAHADGGLPLLQFALAELWEARDTRSGTITQAALTAMGGVSGALARHADAVVAGMRPEQRAEARRMLMRLVTLEDTRARRSEAELRADSPTARAALDALVRGRLLVAQDAEEGSAYEVAHEVLIRGWGSLRRWLAEDAEIRAARERLATAAAEWRRIGRTRDALWGVAQLVEIAALDQGDWNAVETEFVAASRRSVDRGRWLRRAAAIGIPLAIASVYGTAELRARHALAARVDGRLGEARSALAEARAAADGGRALRAEAFRRFDAQQRGDGEAAWAKALEQTAITERALARASRELEAGMALDPGRGDVRALLGEALLERALVAEASHKVEQEAELVQRFALYDRAGALSRRWSAPAVLSIRTPTPGARASLQRFVTNDSGVGAYEPEQDVGALPLEHLEVERGSYLLLVTAEGHAAVRVPLLVDRGEQLPVEVTLPDAAAVPEAFVYVPPARFLFGSSGDEASRRGFFDTVPLHEIRLDGFLIQRTEVTYADWIAFLSSLPAAERARRMPRVGSRIGGSGALRLVEAGGGYRLELQPAGRAYAAQTDEPLRYEGRKSGAEQVWARLPVTGISAEDVEAYAAWLDQTGRVRGARLCTEYEWELGARGADGRTFPEGELLEAGHANFKDTYGEAAMGPDEVASHPGSRSPLGLEDMAGNAFEWTTSGLAPGEFVVRGGSYYHDQKTAQTANRTVSAPGIRDPTLGARLCASPPR